MSSRPIEKAVRNVDVRSAADRSCYRPAEFCNDEIVIWAVTYLYPQCDSCKVFIDLTRDRSIDHGQFPIGISFALLTLYFQGISRYWGSSVSNVYVFSSK